jgi:O-acetyl-ADP-ribose deacetylase (regulator of RNase III)
MVNNVEIKLIQGDITKLDVDAIVNAANPSLMGGGGVDGAIHRVGGPMILEECKVIRISRYPDGMSTGKAVITTGGNLKARHVIHTVGPIWRGGEMSEELLLEKAYTSSLELANENGLKSIAFPSISTGAYGYPIEMAAVVALASVKDYLKKNTDLEKIFFVLFSHHDYEVYRETISVVFG